MNITFLNVISYVNSNDIGIMIIAFIFLAVVSIYITRAIFSIGTIVKNLEAQTKLLALIASKDPENVDKISGILNETVNK